MALSSQISLIVFSVTMSRSDGVLPSSWKSSLRLAIGYSCNGVAGPAWSAGPANGRDTYYDLAELMPHHPSTRRSSATLQLTARKDTPSVVER